VSNQPSLAWRLRDAAIAAAIALVLAIPLVGLETFDDNGSLGIRQRWSWVAIAVAVVFFGRLAMGWRAGRKVSVKAPVALPKGLGRYFAMGGVAAAILLPFLPMGDSYRSVIDLGTLILIYVMLGWGLNIVVGLAGLLNLGYVAFYAVGAYSYALMAQFWGFGFWQALPLAGLFAAAFGIALGFPVLRLRGDYLAIVTLGFGEMIRIVLLNWQSLTGGSNGISGIPRPTLFGLPLAASGSNGMPSVAELTGIPYAPNQRIAFLYFIILALALLTNFLVLRLRRLPLGRAWEAIREDEIAARSLGLNPTLVKLSAFGLCAMLGGFAGAFFATRGGFISPESFNFLESASILAIVVLGGMGSQTGVVIAAIFLVGLPELARKSSDFAIPLISEAPFRLILFGAAMVLIMVWRPRGLLSNRQPTERLHAEGQGS
jgi:branched-chain amino acid transport system permease protein